MLAAARRRRRPGCRSWRPARRSARSRWRKGRARPMLRKLRTTFRGGALSGEKLPVPDGDVADVAIVAAQGERGVALAHRRSPPARRHARGRRDHRSEPLARAHRLRRRARRAARRGRRRRAPAAARARPRRRAVRLRAGRRRAAVARDGARLRAAALRLRPPDRLVPGDQAQARRHLCRNRAGALQRLLRRLGAAHATRRSCRSPPRRRAISASEAYFLAAKENIQMHGGMGFTWEFDCHLYYRRAKLLSLALGSTRRLEGPPGHPARDGQRAALSAHLRRRGPPWISTTLPKKPRSAPTRAPSSTRTPSCREPGAGMVYRAGNDDPEFRNEAKDWQARKADAGYAGITWPKEWGGRGGTPIQQVIYDQEEAEIRRAARPLRHRARHVRPDDLHLGHAGAARPLCQEGAARGGGLVPAVLRAGRRLRPRRPAHARRARRRRLGRQRPEDLDLRRALLRLRHAGDAHRLRRRSTRGSPSSSST